VGWGGGPHRPCNTQTQTNTIKSINSNISGNATISGVFIRILMSNIKVLLFTILFAFFYGAGTIFILTWNASVIGAAVGNFVRSRVLNFADYFHIIPLGIMRYMTHGFFEILAYFIGGLAGGIVSIALIKHNLQENRVLIDSLDLIRIIDLSSCMFELSKRP